MEVGCSRIESETELISSLAPLKKAAPRILLASLGWMSDLADIATAFSAPEARSSPAWERIDLFVVTPKHGRPRYIRSRPRTAYAVSARLRASFDGVCCELEIGLHDSRLISSVGMVMSCGS